MFIPKLKLTGWRKNVRTRIHRRASVGPGYGAFTGMAGPEFDRRIRRYAACGGFSVAEGGMLLEEGGGTVFPEMPVGAPISPSTSHRTRSRARLPILPSGVNSAIYAMSVLPCRRPRGRCSPSGAVCSLARDTRVLLAVRRENRNV